MARVFDNATGEFVTLADDAAPSATQFRSLEEASEYDPYNPTRMRSLGYVPDIGFGDWQNTSGAGGQRFNNALDYYRYLYGDDVAAEELGGQTWYKTPNGADAILPGRSPISYNPPMSTGFGLTLAAIAAMAGAGFGGAPGTEAGWTSGFDLAGGGDLAGLASGSSSLVGAEVGAVGGVPDVIGSDWASGVFNAANPGGMLPSLGGVTSANTAAGGAGALDLKSILSRVLGTTGGNKMDPLSLGTSVISGLYGLKKSNDLAAIAERAAAMQDPFGSQRPMYQQQLAALMADPSKITTMPGYNAGLQAVERRLASQGYLGSGNMMAALAEYGGSFFDKEANRLATLAGAGISPSGGGALVSGYNASFDAASKALATLGFSAKEIARIFGL